MFKPGLGGSFVGCNPKVQLRLANDNDNDSDSDSDRAACRHSPVAQSIDRCGDRTSVVAAAACASCMIL